MSPSSEFVPTSQEKSDYSEQAAAYELYEKYRWGDEEHGIFIDCQRAKEYYEQAGDFPYKEEWDDSDDPGQEWPSTYEYTLQGNLDTLSAVQKMIRDLCQRFGIPENEDSYLGLFLPQRQLMKQLVGSDTEFYRGNILHVEQPAPNRLLIIAEADRGEPLLYALRYRFENLEVAMKTIE